MPIKRILMLIIAALCLFGAGAIAHADEPLEAVCAFTPADFLEPCTAKLSVTVHNSSDKRIESARISHDPNKESAVIGTIEPGETMHFAYDVQVTKKMLEAGKVNLTISYKIGNKTQKLQTSAIVTQVEHLAKAQLTARIFKSAVYPGEIVQVEYRLVNTGEIAIENAVISDAAFSFASEAYSLAPEEEKCINYMTTFSESAISAPRANFFFAAIKAADSADNGELIAVPAVTTDLIRATSNGRGGFVADAYKSHILPSRVSLRIFCMVKLFTLLHGNVSLSTGFSTVHT